MKKFIFGALILSSLVISGCHKDSGRSDDPKSMNYINPELTNQGKSADVMRGFEVGEESNYN